MSANFQPTPRLDGRSCQRLTPKVFL